MKNSKYIFICIYSFFISCNPSNKKLSKEQVQEIKDTYIPEEITYFYETVFFVDPEARDYKPFKGNTKICKWDTDIYIEVYGNKTEENIASLKKSIKSLNTLDLPIKLYLSNKKEGNNIHVYFGSKEYLEKELNKKLPQGFAFDNGFGDYEINSKGYNMKAIIGIEDSYESTESEASNRILEELTQVLGIPGDSYSHINSIFYQSRSPIADFKLINLDKKVLQLLYSKNIAVGLTMEEFYANFKEILPHTQLTNQAYLDFENFILKKEFSQETINLFLKTGFKESNYIINSPNIQKWHNNLEYTFKDKIAYVDSVLISRNITLINKLIGARKILYKKRKKYNANLTFYYEQEEKSFNQFSYTGKDMLRYQIYKGKILILNRDNKIEESAREKIILKQLLIVLGFKLQMENLESSEIFGKIDANTPLLSINDEELISLFFSETLKSGMTKDKIVKILEKHYTINKNELNTEEE
ncbi:Protein of unknown function (DUF2927) [Maribacter vaceletii]|uniref:Lipoprotein n=1 Tax=Maribacter vaceletii TaxID=1206816 RepID=A0A495E7F1_9FLAO|nr:DUF2927 domain-containing protein [Maribacter vaceletii]RKR12844.1 Protein of unknown function (DUF2927) [Maribacter vaceletii]